MRDALKLFALVLTLAVTGCGGGGASDAELVHPATAALPASVTVTLPPVTAVETGAKVDPGCARALTVELSEAGGSLNGALVSDTLVGGCERLVKPNRRFYALHLVSQACGSSTYEGRLADGRGMSALTVVDHRERVCDDAARSVSFEVRERSGTVRHYVAP